MLIFTREIASNLISVWVVYSGKVSSFFARIEGLEIREPLVHNFGCRRNLSGQLDIPAALEPAKVPSHPLRRFMLYTNRWEATVTLYNLLFVCSTVTVPLSANSER